MDCKHHECSGAMAGMKFPVFFSGSGTFTRSRSPGAPRGALRPGCPGAGTWRDISQGLPRWWLSCPRGWARAFLRPPPGAIVSVWDRLRKGNYYRYCRYVHEIQSI